MLVSFILEFVKFFKNTFPVKLTVIESMTKIGTITTALPFVSYLLFHTKGAISIAFVSTKYAFIAITLPITNSLPQELNHCDGISATYAASVESGMRPDRSSIYRYCTDPVRPRHSPIVDHGQPIHCHMVKVYSRTSAHQAV